MLLDNVSTLLLERTTNWFIAVLLSARTQVPLKTKLSSNSIQGWHHVRWKFTVQEIHNGILFVSQSYNTLVIKQTNLGLYNGTV